MPNSTSTNTPTLASVIQMAVDSRSRNTAVALPGTVVSYDEGSQSCAVKPGVHRLVPSREEDGEDEVEVLPTLQGVPVCWLVGRGIQVKAKLQAGDSVLLIALDRDADGWLDTGEPAEPGDSRVHTWNSAVAIPGLVPASSPFPEPLDAAALASYLDALITALKALPVVGSALSTLFPNISFTPAGPLTATTTGSSILLLDEPLLP